MAGRSGLSKSTIGPNWRKFDIKPHLTGTFKLSADPLFVDKVVDVVGLYHHPPERAVVVCVDEKSGIQALDRSQPVLPMMPGVPERRSHDYVPAWHDRPVRRVQHRRRHRDLQLPPPPGCGVQEFLARIDEAVPAGLEVHLVCGAGWRGRGARRPAGRSGLCSRRVRGG